jgi:hypothetical protein
MPVANSVSIFAEGTFEEQVRNIPYKFSWLIMKVLQIQELVNYLVRHRSEEERAAFIRPFQDVLKKEEGRKPIEEDEKRRRKIFAMVLTEVKGLGEGSDKGEYFVGLHWRFFAIANRCWLKKLRVSSIYFTPICLASTLSTPQKRRSSSLVCCEQSRLHLRNLHPLNTACATCLLHHVFLFISYSSLVVYQICLTPLLENHVCGYLCTGPYCRSRRLMTSWKFSNSPGLV